MLVLRSKLKLSYNIHYSCTFSLFHHLPIFNCKITYYQMLCAFNVSMVVASCTTSRIIDCRIELQLTITNSSVKTPIPLENESPGTKVPGRVNTDYQINYTVLKN